LLSYTRLVITRVPNPVVYDVEVPTQFLTAGCQAFLFMFQPRVCVMKNILFKVVMAAAVIVSPLASAADIEAGKAKAATCAACHGPAGISAVGMWPNLAGQKEEYLAKQIKAFRDGTRSDPSMSPMAAPLSDADIANLAAYFSSLGCK
jgi:cytochrome c553